MSSKHIICTKFGLQAVEDEEEEEEWKKRKKEG
jgi:hypothetical protein